MLKESMLMCDSTEGDGKAEIVMDYVMSWSLRHATDNYINEKPILSKYCRYMLGKLLDTTIGDTVCVKSVEVWREWQYMDLCVEAIIEKEGVDHNYALLIENKYYSQLHDDQLKRYQAKFDEFYVLKRKETDDEWILKHKLVSCLEEQEKAENMYGSDTNGTDFEILTFYKLIDETLWDKDKGEYKDSESEIFNEFWLRRW